MDVELSPAVSSSQEITHSTVSETLTCPTVHPIQQFFDPSEADTSSFPFIYLTVEFNQRFESLPQVYIPLRIPGRSGLVYESFVRVKRVTELPKVNGQGHRRFYELEWRVDENPILELENHAALSFLSSEVECPGCKSCFIPDPDILSDSAIKITCPNCLHYWTLKVDSPALSQPKVLLITDRFYRSPNETRAEMKRWAGGREALEATSYRRFFPAQLREMGEEFSFQWFFGEGHRIIQAESQNESLSFELFCKSVLNFSAWQFFKSATEARSESNAEKTEIAHKTKAEPKRPENQKAFIAGLSEVPAGELQLRELESMAQPFEILTHPYVSQKQLDQLAQKGKSDFTGYHSEASSSNGVPLKVVAASFALSLTLIGSVAGYFLYQKHQSEQLTQARWVEARQQLSADSPKLEFDNSELLENAFAKQIEPAKEVEQQAVLPEPVKEELVEQVEQVKKEAASPMQSVGAEPSITVKNETPEPAAIAQVAAIDSKQAFKSAFFQQGLLYMKLKQFESAIGEFNRVIELDPKHDASYRNLGLALVHRRRYKEALDAFEQYLALSTTPSSDRRTIVEITDQLRSRIQ